MKPSADSSENSTLQSQYTELYSRYDAISTENKQMHDELTRKTEIIDDLQQCLARTERALCLLDAEFKQAKLTHQDDIECYSRSVEELQRQTQRRIDQANEDVLRLLTLYQNADEKYQKLHRSYKALQRNLELEQNLKALLIDQIEHLKKERKVLFSQVDRNLSSVSGSENDSIIIPANKRHLLGNSTYEPQDAHDLSRDPGGSSGHSLSLDSDSDGSVHASHENSSFGEHPENQNLSAEFTEVLQDFHFSLRFAAPTTAEIQDTYVSTASKVSESLPSAKPRSRNSLPPRIETHFLHTENSFVPSPLKLTRPNSTSIEGDFSLGQGASDPQHSRRSHPRSPHSRINSLDLLPIKVKFEQAHQQPRSASTPERNFFKNLDSVAEGEDLEDGRDIAFMKLNGFAEPNPRDSLLTTSSKRSSLFTDYMILNRDITKEEITKLKFELQSLRLHNEKLLSYIGFELQKQKNNIKHLSSKQRLRPNSMEYSDAKLIERLKNMLIHKKRVLRLVSINPILSTKYDNQGHLFLSGAGIGIASISLHLDEGEDFVFRSLFMGSLDRNCDDYGFLNQQSKYNLRILSEQHQKYLHEGDEKFVKKFKSQTFLPDRSLDDSEDFELLDDEYLREGLEDESGNTVMSAGEWDTTSDRSSSSGYDVNYYQLNRFNQMKYIVFGKEHMKRQKKKDELVVDEKLKYKFLTLVVGIVIVGFRFTSRSQLQLQGS